MTIAEEIKARVDEFHVVYDEIHALRTELRDLQQAERAQAEYKNETSQFDKELALLAEQKSNLGIELRKRKIREDTEGLAPPPPPTPPVFHVRPDPLPIPEAKPEPAVAAQVSRKGARLELQKLVGKYGRLWQLSGEVRGSINRIAKDTARPLGEALALLEWETFAAPIAHREGASEHLNRLKDWGQALMEYRDWLGGEMDMLRTRYRKVLPIMAAWINRETADGRARWDRQIAETLAAKQAEMKALSEEVERLNAELNQLRVHV